MAEAMLERESEKVCAYCLFLIKWLRLFRGILLVGPFWVRYSILLVSNYLYTVGDAGTLGEVSDKIKSTQLLPTTR